MNLQELVDQIENLKKNINSEMNFKNLYQICQILNTQFLAPRVKKMFSGLMEEGDVFIFSCAQDPNFCQLSFHKEWTSILFAWVRPDGVFIFRIPKEVALTLGTSINHADSEMIKSNTLFKHSIRLTEDGINQLYNYLVEIID